MDVAKLGQVAALDAHLVSLIVVLDAAVNRAGWWFSSAVIDPGKLPLAKVFPPFADRLSSDAHHAE